MSIADVFKVRDYGTKPSEREWSESAEYEMELSA